MQIAQKHIVLALFFFASALGGCASEGIPASEVIASDRLGAAKEQTYRIGPGDTLEVFVWRNPEISTNVQVRPDGMISTPLVEDMVAVTKTPTQLARDMELVLAKYIKAPSVNIIVSGFHGTSEDMVRVVGQAQNPQAVPYRDGMTVLDLMIAVGGLGEFAAGNRSKLVRKVSGENQEYRIRLADLLNKGKIEHNVDILPGDVLIIPEAFF
jgi:polysaccharide export outer membrane protein